MVNQNTNLKKLFLTKNDTGNLNKIFRMAENILSKYFVMLYATVFFALAQNRSKTFYEETANDLILKWDYKTEFSKILTLHIFHESRSIVTCQRQNETVLECVHANSTKYKLVPRDNLLQLCVYRLTYGDNGNYHGFINSQNDDGNSEHLFDYTLKVKGRPYICDKDEHKSYTYNEGDSPIFNITICGFPRPKYKWRFGMSELSISEKIMKNDFKYILFAQLPILQASMCGEKLQLLAENDYGTIDAVLATVHVNFSLPVIESLNINQEKSCHTISWQSVQSGHCNVQYEVQAFDINKNEIGLYITPVLTESISVCTSKDKNIEQPIKAKIRCRYNSQYGNWSELAESSAAVSVKPSRATLIIGVSVGLVVFLGFLILTIYLLKGKYKNGNTIWKVKGEKRINKSDFTDVSLLNMNGSVKRSSSSAQHYVDMSAHYTDINDVDKPFKPMYSKLIIDDKLYENMNDIKENVKPTFPEYEEPSIRI